MQLSSSENSGTIEIAAVGAIGFLARIKNILGITPSSSKSPLLSLASKVDFDTLGLVLSYRIRQKEYFIQALLHRSYLQNVTDLKVQSNERLEFLGDSILNLLAAEYLYSLYPRAEEGELTVMRSRLVNRKALVSYAKKINLRKFLIATNGVFLMPDKGAETVLADAFEAVIGALYLDGGIEPARAFVRQSIIETVRSGFLVTEDGNFKSALLEYGQARGRGIPRYVIIKEEGPDHDRTFTAEVFIGNTSLGIGEGKNKKEAEQSAASEAMKIFEKTNCQP